MRLVPKFPCAALASAVALLAAPVTVSAQSAPPAQVAPIPPPTAAPHPPRQTSSSRVLGRELVNADDDTDIAVGRATINAAEPWRRDVIESRPEERRKVDGKQVTAAPLFGYATNDLAFGIGARGGYTFDVPVYVGGSFLYHTGDTLEPGAPGLGETDRRFVVPSGEVGYDFGIGPLLARPYVGAGLLVRRATTAAAGGVASSTDTDTALLVYPGATVQWFLPGTPAFVGGDTRVYIPFAHQSGSFGLFATAGLNL